ncbi:hypothetical protein [Nocardia sp. SC052]|uniref:hypothetical protein n=1 Tax=Nocardia sichangensis TaxID=3385975 RepID=UPI0039A212C2
MSEPNPELSFLKTSAREADAEGRTLVIDPGYVFEALEKLAEARTRIAELEAAQRPPIGYVVLEKRPHRSEPGDFDYRPVGSIWGEREPAESDAGAWQDAAIADRKRYGNVEYVLGEVREVQP